MKVFERCVCSSKTRGNVQNVEIGGGKSNPTGEIAVAIRCGSTWVTGIAQPTVCKDPKRERKALLPMIALLGMQSTVEIRNRNSRRQGPKPNTPCSQFRIEHARTVSTENHTQRQCRTTVMAVGVLVECSQQTLKINFRGDG